ncbi:MAG: hypothetical protein MUP21_13750, partial [Dehalococcoidia bacterium]|nr:hypothetical protein [Dehalococcoidia bacterium]
LRQFNQGLVGYLRGLLMVKAGAEEAADFPSDVIAEMRKLASEVSLADISNAIKLFAHIVFRMDPQSTLSLELALVDCSLSAVTREPLAPIPAKATPFKKEAPLLPAMDTVQPSTETVNPAQASPQTEIHADDGQSVVEAAEVVALEQPRSVDDIRQHWSHFINACRGVGSSGNLDALLRSSCEAVALEGNTLTLGFYANFHKDTIENPKYRHLVEKKLQDVFGVPYQVRCVLSPKKSKDVKEQQQKYHPLVSEAVKMGGRIIEEE